MFQTMCYVKYHLTEIQKLKQKKNKNPKKKNQKEKLSIIILMHNRLLRQYKHHYFLKYQSTLKSPTQQLSLPFKFWTRLYFPTPNPAINILQFC